MPFESPRGRTIVAQTRSVPAPVGGLNFRDSAAAMPVTDALRMVNFQPLPYAVAIRKGWSEWNLGYNGPVESIFCHAKPDGSEQVLTVAAGSINVQTAPNTAPTVLASGLGSNYWLGTMMANSGGTFTYLVNGVDAARVWDGTALTTVLEVASPATGFNVHGLNPNLFANVCLHQRRLWFAEKNSARAWYLPVDQVGGDLEEFDLGPVWAMGGYLMAIASWTVDAGKGMDDYIAFISSRGEIALYSGADPSDVSTFSLQGVFTIGSPVGRRCTCKYGGDVLLITRDGLVPLSKALQSTRVNSQVAITDKIQHLISALVSEYGNVPGWETFLFPNENQVWLLVPTTDAVTILSMNTITGSWCEYRGMNAASICLFGDTPLFGTRDGRVGLAWQGYQDDVKLGTGVGNYIEGEVLTAYNYFETPGQQKRWVFTRPILQSGVIPSTGIAIDVDFQLLSDEPSPVLPDPVPSEPIWGVALWGISFWPTRDSRYRNWISVVGLGYCAALNMRVKQSTALLWTASDFIYEAGAPI